MVWRAPGTRHTRRLLRPLFQCVEIRTLFCGYLKRYLSLIECMIKCIIQRLVTLSASSTAGSTGSIV